MSSVMDAPPPTCQHSSHPAHKLRLVQIAGGKFQCDGCKQGGQEDRRYRCEPCDFDLHIQCALAPPVFLHPMFGGRKFTLCPAVGNRFCDACGDGVLGTAYHNSQADLDFHPCCAFLKDRIGNPGRVFQLHKEVAASCMLCGQNGPRGKFWSYTLHDKGGVENIHVACMLYADHNPTGVAGRSRSTYSHQMTGNSAFGHQMTGNSAYYGHQMTGNSAYGHQMTGNSAYGHQMTGNSASGNQKPGNSASGYQKPANTASGYQKPGNSASGYQKPGNSASGYQMPGNTSSGYQMLGGYQTPGTSVFGVVDTIGDFASLASSILDITHNVTAGDSNNEVDKEEDDGEKDEEEDEEEEEEEDEEEDDDDDDE